ncbi:fungal-specific transcription factor domain-containing protein [Ilyonectria sp. MPI-CAGE-AT-0026]|nr:fungal-specific transcription factor domain-containing protein [Ilyonectria sp. MPI-CAGE-AT-0026]
MSREIGSLRALSNGESQYVGSSSGVFFINTVRRAFSTAATATSVDEPSQQGNQLGQPLGNPSPEDCIVGGEEQADPVTHSNVPGEPNGTQYPAAELHQHESPWDVGHLDELAKLPDYAVARQLVMTYFRIWHPLVPFLRGPAVLADLDALYADTGGEQARKSPSLSQSVIFRCIFNIAGLDRPDLPALGPAGICSPTQILPALSLLALKCDISSIQALLSAQVYFVATMSLRNSSTVGGLVSKSIVQSGLHRCPHRYGHLSPDDRSMRKRTFWSAYVLDRFLSQSLGHPNGIQDSDIDVCPPGARDLHEPVAHSAMSPSSPAGDDAILHLPVNHPERRAASPRLQGRSKEGSAEDDHAGGSDPEAAAKATSPEPAAISQHRRQVQGVLASHVRYSQLIGRMLEIFHKSIHVRAADGRAVLFLKADLGAWGNNLVQPCTDNASGQQDANASAPLGPDPTVFPFISYQYSLLLVNRPSLSLDPGSAEFHSAIQICIGAGTTIIQTMEKHSELGYPMFWPGFMSAVWMSGLVLAFASQLRMHSAAKAISGISSALKLLTVMTNRWRMAKHCKSVLATLLTGIEAKAAGRKRSRWEDELPPSSRPVGYSTAAPSSRSSNGEHQDGLGISKRRSIGPRRDIHPPPSRYSPFSQDMSAMPDFSPQSNTLPLPSPRNSTFNSCQPDFSQGQKHPGGWRESAGGPNAQGDDLSNLYHPAMRFHDHTHPDQLDYTFGATWADLSHPSLQYQRQLRMPIPTTFPDRLGSRPYPNVTLADGSVFDVFDGATWGSLLDLVDNSAEEQLL